MAATVGCEQIQGDGGNHAREDKSSYRRLARAVSVLMHPFVMPLYAVLLLMFGNTFMQFIPVKVKWFIIMIVVANTFVIPAMFIGVLRSLGYIKNFSLEARRDRTVPLMVAAIFYFLCAYMVSDIHVAFLIRKYILAGAACVLLALSVTCFWKISLHMVAAGGVTAMLLVTHISGLGNIMVPVIALIMFSGALASARLYLGMHTPAQIGVGYLAGFAAAFTVIVI